MLRLENLSRTTADSQSTGSGSRQAGSERANPPHPTHAFPPVLRGRNGQIWYNNLSYDYYLFIPSCPAATTAAAAQAANEPPTEEEHPPATKAPSTTSSSASNNSNKSNTSNRPQSHHHASQARRPNPKRTARAANDGNLHPASASSSSSSSSSHLRSLGSVRFLVLSISAHQRGSSTATANSSAADAAPALSPLLPFLGGTPAHRYALLAALPRRSIVGEGNGEGNEEGNGDVNQETNGETNGETNEETNGETNGEENVETNGDVNGEENVEKKIDKGKGKARAIDSEGESESQSASTTASTSANDPNTILLRAHAIDPATITDARVLDLLAALQQRATRPTAGPSGAEASSSSSGGGGAVRLANSGEDVGLWVSLRWLRDAAAAASEDGEAIVMVGEEGVDYHIGDVPPPPSAQRSGNELLSDVERGGRGLHWWLLVGRLEEHDGLDVAEEAQVGGFLRTPLEEEGAGAGRGFERHVREALRVYREMRRAEEARVEVLAAGRGSGLIGEAERVEWCRSVAFRPLDGEGVSERESERKLRVSSVGAAGEEQDPEKESTSGPADEDQNPEKDSSSGTTVGEQNPDGRSSSGPADEVQNPNRLRTGQRASEREVRGPSFGPANEETLERLRTGQRARFSHPNGRQTDGVTVARPSTPWRTDLEMGMGLQIQPGGDWSLKSRTCRKYGIWAICILAILAIIFGVVFGHHRSQIGNYN